MVKPTKSKQSTGNQFEKIVETLQEDVNRLEKELERYVSTPRIAMGIRRNLEDRKEDLKYYVSLTEGYKNKGWTE